MTKTILFMFISLLIGNHLMANNELDYFKKLPKAELHLHLGGAYPLDYLETIGSPEQIIELKQYLAVIKKGMPYSDAFRVFQIVGQIVNSNEKVEKGVQALCNNFREEGVVYAEIRTGLKNFGNGFEEYLKAVLRGMENAGLETYLLLSLQRNSTYEMAKLTVDLALKYRDIGVVGIDLSGDASVGAVEKIFPELIRAKNEGLALIVHMGEVPNEKDQLQILQQLQPDRLGHGVYLCSEAEQWMLEKKIPLEICLTSSVAVRMIDDYNEHPGIRYYRAGHPVTLCTDDPLIFSTTLNHEFQLAFEFCGLSVADIESISTNTFNYILKPKTSSLQ